MHLSNTKTGQKVLVKEIKNSSIKNILQKFGILIKDEIVVTKIAIGGSPIAIKNNNTEIAIRKNIAEYIEVEPVE